MVTPCEEKRWLRSSVLPFLNPGIVAISFLVASVVGWGSYISVTSGISPLAIEPMSLRGLRLIGSALISLVLTTGFLHWLGHQQPMVYVAAFTVAVGAFPSVQSLIIAILAVLLMAGLQAIRRTFGPGAIELDDEPRRRPFEQ